MRVRFFVECAKHTPVSLRDVRCADYYLSNYEYLSLFVCSCSAAALQSVVMLMGVNNLYNYHQDRYWRGEGSYEWNVDIAREVLETWQKNFTKVCYQYS